MSMDPWTVYWQGDHLESCIASQSPADSKQIAAYWQDLASQLADASLVLDLASGNGAIPQLLLSVNRTLDICAVDKAEIAPLNYLSQAGELASVRFLPATDICDLPFAPISFDAVTSQFGLEYAPLTRACQCAVKVLKKHGTIRLLMHHQDSEILRPTTAILSEIARLLAREGVMAGIESYLAERIDFNQLETIGQHYLRVASVRTRQVSGQVFAGITQIAAEVKRNPGHARTLMVNMKKKLVAEQARLLQLQDAALNAEQAHKVEETLTDLGIIIDLFKPLTIDDDEGGKILIGWQLSGIKK